jgi:REP element-mobilizing transposase RayT
LGQNVWYEVRSRMKYLGASPEVSSLDRKFIVLAGLHTPIRRSFFNFFRCSTFNRGKPRGMDPRLPINNREPLFRRGSALAIFARVFHETELRFRFAVCRLSLEDDWLRFYIKPVEGLELPEIMQWLKQVFAQRVNQAEGRIGHIWGDRYWSRIVEGVPPVEGEGEEPAVDGGETAPGVRPRWRGKAAGTGFSMIFPLPAAPSPG